MGSVSGGEAGLIRLEIALEVEDRFGITIPEHLDWQTVRDIHQTLVAALATSSPGPVDAAAAWARLRDFLVERYGVPAGQVVPDAELFGHRLRLDDRPPRLSHRGTDLPSHVLQASQAFVTQIEQIQREKEAVLEEEADYERGLERAAQLSDQALNVQRRRDTFIREWIAQYVIDRSWLCWRGGTVPKLAQAISQERRWEDLPFLADALEDADCTDQEILNHCRQAKGHVRGCWVVDLLLDKTHL
jgi:hypothetical protein